jgi:hypothetical protein
MIFDINLSNKSIENIPIENIININFNVIEKNILFNELNNIITISFFNDNDILLFTNNYDIYYNINETINTKNYYIIIENDIINNLNNSNFKIKLPKKFYFNYSFYKNELLKSIIIYCNNNYIPIIYLGLPNEKKKISFQINYKYKNINSNNNLNNDNIFDNICDNECIGDYDGKNTIYLTLLNNFFGNDNYYLNTLKLLGNIYEICIQNNLGIINYESLNSVYKLFKIKNNISLDTNIYIYNDINTVSYILNLNSYNIFQKKIYQMNMIQ